MENHGYVGTWRQISRFMYCYTPPENRKKKLIPCPSHSFTYNILNWFISLCKIARILQKLLDVICTIFNAWRFYRYNFDPPTTLRDIRRIAVEEWDNLGQQCLDELVDTGMHQCKGTCYWVLEVLVCIAICTTISESLSVWWYIMQYVVFMNNKNSWNVVCVDLCLICM